MDTDDLLSEISQGDASAASLLFARHRDRLRKMIAWRIDDRLSARVDPSDVVQDVLVEAHARLPEYLADGDFPFYLWLRSIAWQKLIDLHRRHVVARKRTITREADGMGLSAASRLHLVDRLAAPGDTPSDMLVRHELRARIEEALDQLIDADREVIVLKHLEELSFPEVAVVLQISGEAARSRYRRAIQRLQRLLAR